MENQELSGAELLQILKSSDGAMTAQQIVDSIMNGPGSSTLFNAEAAAREQQKQQDQLNQLISEQRRDIDGGWRGQAADSAKAATNPMLLVTDKASQQLAAAQGFHTQQAFTYNQLRDSLLKIPPDPGKAGFVDVIFPMFSDHADQVTQYQEAVTHNIQHYRTYGKLSVQNADNVPQGFGVVSGKDNSGEDSYSAASPGLSNTNSKVASMRLASGKLTQSSKTPTSLESQEKSSEQTTGSGVVPVQSGTKAQGVTVDSGQSVIPSSSPNANSGFQNVDIGQHEPYRSGSVSGSVGNPVGGESEHSLGSGRKVGVGFLPGVSATSVRLASVDARGVAGNPMMGGPPAAKDPNGEDREHRRAPFLQEFDPESVFIGDLPMTTRPVLGE